MIDPLALVTEHAFDIRINFDKRWLWGPVNGGDSQGYTSVGTDGWVKGPLLNGKVVDYSGADWATVRSDGVVEANAHYVLEADDGARIYMRNLGYIHGPIRASQAAAGGAIAPYFRCTPYFRAAEGPHEWLNRCVIVGIGQRHPRGESSDEPDHTLFRYYVVR